mgnify:CR=1 FL=1
MLLKISFIGVPEKSNALRIQFSRYLSYEKWTNPLLLTLNVNLGGFTPVWEVKYIFNLLPLYEGGIFNWYASNITSFNTLVLISFQKFVTKLTGSVAVSADSAHYTVDVLTNASIIISLLVVKIFNVTWFDILTAALISVYLIYNAYKIAYDAIAELTDKELSQEIREQVINIIEKSEGIKGFHDLRSRDLGGTFLFEIHLEFDGNLNLFKVHEFTENVEKKIQEQYPNSQIIIHQDPFGIKETRLDDILNGKCKL